MQMKRTGIPELTCIEDIDYLRNVLLLNKTDEEAAEHFTRQVCSYLNYIVMSCIVGNLVISSCQYKID